MTRFSKSRFAKKKAVVVVAKPKRRRRMSKRLHICNMGMGLPDSVRQIVEYTGNATQAGTGANTYTRWNLNSCFDPDSTGGGHQPKYFDQMMALYTKYRVINTRWEVDVINTSSVQLRAIATDTDNTTLLTYDQIAEDEDARRTICGVSSSDSAYRRIRGNTYLPKFCGQTLAQYTADSVTYGTETASPTQTAILLVRLTSADESTTVSANLRIKFWQTVIWFNRRSDIALS